MLLFLQSLGDENGPSCASIHSSLVRSTSLPVTASEHSFDTLTPESCPIASQVEKEKAMKPLSKSVAVIAAAEESLGNS